MRLIASGLGITRVILFLCVSAPTAVGQSASRDSLRAVPQTDRVVAANSSRLTSLSGHLPVWVDPANLSSTQVAPEEQLRLTMVLRRSAAAEQAFKTVLEEQQTPGSPLYHRAVSPSDQGMLYGPTQHDIAAITQWTTSQGLTVEDVSPSRTQLRLEGSAAAVSSAFRVHFSMYNTVRGMRRAPDSEPQIPTGLSAVIDVVVGLTPEELYPQNAATAMAASSNSMHSENSSQVESLKPMFTGSKGNHFITPADFAKIYDVTPTYAANN